jgi:putative ABC transport system ATP-binding protein
MIQATGLVKYYRDGDREVRPLDGVDFRCERGEFVLILGRSGSGKTTLLNILGGLARPAQGSVRVDGKEILTLPDTECAALRSRTIGFVFQFPGLVSTLTAGENVVLPSDLVGAKSGEGDAARRAAQLLEVVGLAGKAGRFPSRLSDGELKRTAIARALMNRPAVILADEPTADLDAETERKIMELFSRINREGTTIVMVTHNTDLIPYASRVLCMENGKLSPA